MSDAQDNMLKGKAAEVIKKGVENLRVLQSFNDEAYKYYVIVMNNGDKSNIKDFKGLPILTSEGEISPRFQLLVQALKNVTTLMGSMSFEVTASEMKHDLYYIANLIEILGEMEGDEVISLKTYFEEKHAAIAAEIKSREYAASAPRGIPVKERKSFKSILEL